MLDVQKPKRRKREHIQKLMDGREICHSATGWSRRRRQVFDRENGLCERCMTFAPLHNTEYAFAGHAHHVNGRKRNDDRMEALEWLCGHCHAVEHQPLKVLPAKVKEEAV